MDEPHTHEVFPVAAQEEARRRLARIEEEDGVRILYACESGSRAWGFSSKDSDWDVRFLYVRPVDWYLSIDVETRRDVIERPIDGLWDVNGWDLRKALRLLRKSNPPLYEWLQSPLVYRQDSSSTDRLRGLLPPFFNPAAATYHYLHMARKNHREYLKGERVRPKKYFYVLRPLLACRWIEAGRGVVPMAFDALREATVDDEALNAVIEDLLVKKRAGDELDEGPAIPELNAFLEAELTRHEAAGVSRLPPTEKTEDLSAVFRSVLAEVWSR